jgi:hypothetical protein
MKEMRFQIFLKIFLSLKYVIRDPANTIPNERIIIAASGNGKNIDSEG